MVNVELANVFAAPLTRVPIAVNELVRRMTDEPKRFVLSFAYARVPAAGASLRAVAYYGDDLAEAALFREKIDLMIFYKCGLRNVVGGPEIIRLGQDGAISFFSGSGLGRDRLLAVEEILSFLKSGGYLDQESWGGSSSEGPKS